MSFEDLSVGTRLASERRTENIVWGKKETHECNILPKEVEEISYSAHVNVGRKLVGNTEVSE